MKTIKKKVSKKNKSAWRKHSDVKDVLEFLEDQRQSERIGDFSHKKNEEIFMVDIKQNSKLLSTKERRKLSALGHAENVISLENNSAVQDPLKKRNKVKYKRNGRNIQLEVINPTCKKHIQANKDRNNYYSKLTKQVCDLKKHCFNKDIWGNEDNILYKEFTKQEWVSKNLALYHLSKTGRSIVKPPTTIRKKTSALKPIQKPDPGISYNPTLLDHENLISKVMNKEEHLIKKENHLNRVTTLMFSKVTENERDNNIKKELICGLFDKDVNAQKSECGLKYESLNPPITIKKKNKKTRRNQKKRKEIELQLQENKFKKKKSADINILSQIERKILIEEQQKNEMKKKKKIELKKRKYEPKRLSKLKFKELEIVFNQENDIAGNLRNIKTENSLLIDQFKTLQQRNILPVSIDVGVRKRRKIKRFVRSSHKETLK